MSRHVAIAIVGFVAVRAASSIAAELPPEVLVQSSRVTITRSDFDADLANIPRDLQIEFAASGERLSKRMNAMLETKTLAFEARANGLDKDPAIQARIAQQIERVLALARNEQIEREAGEAFDRRRDDFLGRAREIYLLEREKYTLPERVRAAHILVKTDKRDKEAALQLAMEIRARAVAEGADFTALARQYSEDPTAKTNGGNLGWFEAKQMDRAFSAGAFALQKPGDISEPVLSSFGFHIIRLDARKPAELPPFEAVKDVILADVKRDYVKGAKIAVLDGIYRDPTLRVNQAAIDGLVTTIDPEAVRKAGTAIPK